MLKAFHLDPVDHIGVIIRFDLFSSSNMISTKCWHKSLTIAKSGLPTEANNRRTERFVCPSYSCSFVPLSFSHMVGAAEQTEHVQLKECVSQILILFLYYYYLDFTCSTLISSYLSGKTITKWVNCFFLLFLMFSCLVLWFVLLLLSMDTIFGVCVCVCWTLAIVQWSFNSLNIFVLNPFGIYRTTGTKCVWPESESIRISDCSDDDGRLPSLLEEFPNG